MFKSTKQLIASVKTYCTDLLTTLRAILATQTETLAELRVQTALLEKRDNELSELTGHAAYLVKAEQHKLHRAGQPPIN
jgi:hypothetical protein